MDAKHARSICELIDRSNSQYEPAPKEKERNRFLYRLGSSDGGVLRITLEAGLPVGSNEDILEFVTYSLFGAARDQIGFSTEMADLRCLWPLGDGLPGLIVRPPDAPKKNETAISTSAAGDGLALGRLVTDGSDVIIRPRDRARHSFVTGGTGTGKTTLLLNLLLTLPVFLAFYALMLRPVRSGPGRARCCAFRPACPPWCSTSWRAVARADRSAAFHTGPSRHLLCPGRHRRDAGQVVGEYASRPASGR